MTLSDVICDLLPEWACLTLLDRNAFRLTSNLADIPVSRVKFAHGNDRAPKVLNPLRKLLSGDC